MSRQGKSGQETPKHLSISEWNVRLALCMIGDCISKWTSLPRSLQSPCLLFLQAMDHGWQWSPSTVSLIVLSLMMFVSFIIRMYNMLILAVSKPEKRKGKGSSTKKTLQMTGPLPCCLMSIGAHMSGPLHCIRLPQGPFSSQTEIFLTSNQLFDQMSGGFFGQ